MKNTSKKTRKLSRGEIFWIVVTSLIGFAGVFLAVLGIVGDYLPVLLSENWIQLSENAMSSVIGLDYRYLGVILVIVAALIAVIFLNHYAKKSDAEAERALRRAQRMQIVSESDSATPEVIDAEAKPVDSKQN